MLLKDTFKRLVPLSLPVCPICIVPYPVACKLLENYSEEMTKNLISD